MTLSKAAIKSAAVDIERLAEVIRMWTEENREECEGEDGGVIEECEKIESCADYIVRMLGGNTEERPKSILLYRCTYCGKVGPTVDTDSWMGGPVSGGGFMVTHWCSDGPVGEPFEQGWHEARPTTRRL